MAVEVVVPMLGITVERGKIVEWLKKEGDPVKKGEIIFIVEVEKATTEVESPASGILANPRPAAIRLARSSSTCRRWPTIASRTCTCSTFESSNTNADAMWARSCVLWLR